MPISNPVVFCGSCNKAVVVRKGAHCDAIVCDEYHCTVCGNTIESADVEAVINAQS